MPATLPPTPDTDPDPTTTDPDPTTTGPDPISPVDDPVTPRSLLDAISATGRSANVEELVVHLRTLGPDPRFDALTDAELEQRLVRSTSELAARMCEWLELLAEVVVRGRWAAQGARTPTAWVSWLLGIAPSTAREHLRVAVRLRELPEIRRCFAEGRLSYSKVRALTRIAVPELEEMLLRWATHATGADLERIAAGVQRSRRARTCSTRKREARRGVDLLTTDDGDTLLQLRCAPEDGFRLLAILDRLVELEDEAEQQDAARSTDEAVPGHPDHRDPLARGTHGAAGTHGAEGTHGAAGTADGPPPRDPQADDQRRGLRFRRAEVLTAVLDAAQGQLPADTSGADRHTLVLHVEASALEETDGAVMATVPGRVPLAMSASTLRRLACEAGTVLVLRDDDGNPLFVGRRQRSATAAQRRALLVRDQGCRFPGCGAVRHLHAHHVVHWSDGGGTDLDNLVMLCRAHHRTVHRPGWQATLDDAGRFRVVAPDPERPDGLELVIGLPLPPDDTALPDDAEAATAPACEPTATVDLRPTARNLDEALQLDLVVCVVAQELRRLRPDLDLAA